MLRRWSLVLALLLWTSWVRAASPEQVGLFLSFEQRLALSYALQAQGAPAAEKEVVMERAKNYFTRVLKTPVKTVEVKNFDEFLKTFRGNWPDTQSLALDLEKIESEPVRPVLRYRSQSSAVQRKIDRYQAWQREKLLTLASSEKNTVVEAGLRLGQHLSAVASSESVRKAVQSWFLKETDTILEDRMSELDRVGEKIAQSGFAHEQNASLKIFMQTIFGEYFARLGPESRKLIVSAFMGGDLLADDLRKFEIMIQNSGPQLQKLLQVVARQGNWPPDLLKVFRVLENSVRPVPWHQVEKILATEQQNYRFTYFERKPLGVGTMAQVHRAKIELHGKRQDVVVRFLKPGIEGRVYEDQRVLTEVASLLDKNPDFRQSGAPKLTPIVEDVTKTVLAELNQQETIQRQRLARERYQGQVPFKTPEFKSILEFHVPAIFEPTTGTSQLMVQEMVLGGKLDKEAETFKKAIPGLKRVAVEEMAGLWLREVIFKGGFYHSDLHQGNFMLHVTDPRIRLNILDFGMGGVISPYMQRQVMVFGIGSEILSAELMSRALWNISEKTGNALNETQFQRLVAERVNEIKKNGDVKPTMELWTAWAMDQGLKLPYEFISLNRGMGILSKLLIDAGSPHKLIQMVKVEARSQPLFIYQKLVVEEKLPLKDLARLGWTEMRSLLRGQNVSGPAPVGPLYCGAVFQ